MTGGIHIKPGTSATINGIDVQQVIDLAISVARTGRAGFDKSSGVSREAHAVAVTVGRLLSRMRAKGYSKEICRDAVWAKVIDEAQRCSEVAQSEEPVAVNHQDVGSSPTLRATEPDGEE
jgi:hypothetical protein